MLSNSTTTITDVPPSLSGTGYVDVLRLVDSQDAQAASTLSPTQCWLSVQKNDRASNTQENQNPFSNIIEAFLRLSELAKELLLLQANELNEQINKTQDLTDKASYLASEYAALKDDNLWNWENPKMREIIQLMNDLNIKVDGKPVGEWLKDVSQTIEHHETKFVPIEWKNGSISYHPGKESLYMDGDGNWWVKKQELRVEMGIPKYQLLRLERTLSAAGVKEKDTSTQSQTRITQLFQAFQNDISAATNVMTLWFRTISGIFANLKG